MAQVWVTAVRLVGGDGYMFVRIEQSVMRLQIDPERWTDMDGIKSRFEQYYWLNRPIFDPKSFTNISTA